MPKARPPATLDRLRAALDAAAVHRVLIPLDAPAYRSSEIAASLGVAVAAVAVAALADADGDRLAAILPGDARIDPARLADAVGARHARLSGQGAARGREQAPLPAIITGLPTVIDASLLRHELLYCPTGDPSWVVRLEPQALRRATSAIVADIARMQPLPHHREHHATEF